MKTFVRDNGLSLALSAMFVISAFGMILTGQNAFNKELVDHGKMGLGLFAYVCSGNFLSTLFENWESEFLQMAVYVVLTAVLFQRGSSESRDPDNPTRSNDKAPWKRRAPLLATLYEHSLGLTMALLFITSFFLHYYFSLIAANEEAIRHGVEAQTLSSYLMDSQLWFESFQNWQSEFLSTAVLVVLSIFLRHKGSPESKPAGADNKETGT
ncbi:DUF6766 family protein [Mesorhizobium sp. SB112]|uniref:DUF6766 family protein n=1 Tax=Mesorhizobium sp. SB112 TaxID=3151853 RepID=UPI003263B8B6